MKALLFLLVAAVSFFVPPHAPEQPASGSAKVMSDTAFLSAAYTSGLYEMKASRLAHKQTGDQRLKKFATMVEEDQDTLGKELKGLLLIKGCAAPEELTPDQKQRLEDLNQLMGIDFNNQYLDYMKNDQQTVLNMYRAAGKSKDPDIRLFASQAIKKTQAERDSIQSMLIRINKPHPKGW